MRSGPFRRAEGEDQSSVLYESLTLVVVVVWALLFESESIRSLSCTLLQFGMLACVVTLLDALSGAMREEPDVQLARMPRMADAARWGVAASRALGWNDEDYLKALDMQNVFEHEQELTRYAMEQLRAVPGLTIYGPDAGSRGGVISFTLGDIHPHDLASILDQEVGVAVRAGQHCAQPLMERFNLAATARASFYVYTLQEEIDVLVQGLHKALHIFSL